MGSPGRRHSRSTFDAQQHARTKPELRLRRSPTTLSRATQTPRYQSRPKHSSTASAAIPVQTDHKPFALVLSYPDPHHPLEAPRKYADMIPPESVVMPPQRSDEYTDGKIPVRNRQLHDMLGVSVDDPDDVRNAMAVYLAMTRHLDDGIGEVLDHLDATGLTRKHHRRIHRGPWRLQRRARHVGQRRRLLGRAGYGSRCWSHGHAGGVPCGDVDDSMANTIDLLPTILQLSGVADFNAVPSGRRRRRGEWKDQDRWYHRDVRFRFALLQKRSAEFRARPLPSATNSPRRELPRSASTAPVALH